MLIFNRDNLGKNLLFSYGYFLKISLQHSLKCIFCNFCKQARFFELISVNYSVKKASTTHGTILTTVVSILVFSIFSKKQQLWFYCLKQIIELLFFCALQQIILMKRTVLIQVSL
jgi:hypothetical protein